MILFSTYIILYLNKNIFKYIYHKKVSLKAAMITLESGKKYGFLIYNIKIYFLLCPKKDIVSISLKQGVNIIMILKNKLLCSMNYLCCE